MTVLSPIRQNNSLLSLSGYFNERLFSHREDETPACGLRKTGNPLVCANVFTKATALGPELDTEGVLHIEWKSIF